MLGHIKQLLRVPKETLLERLSPENARTALDVGCGTGDDVAELAVGMPSAARRSAWMPARRLSSSRTGAILAVALP